MSQRRTNKSGDIARCFRNSASDSHARGVIQRNGAERRRLGGSRRGKSATAIRSSSVGSSFREHFALRKMRASSPCVRREPPGRRRSANVGVSAAGGHVSGWCPARSRARTRPCPRTAALRVVPLNRARRARVRSRIPKTPRLCHHSCSFVFGSWSSCIISCGARGMSRWARI